MVLLASLAACSDSDPTAPDPPPSNAPIPLPPLPPVQSGTFRDSEVAGLAFVSGQEQGVTDARGRYSCETGTDIGFAVGAVSIGAAPCTTLVMPPSLVASGALADPRALNIARFLLMLDEDGEPGNGIAISASVQQIAAGWPQVDFDEADLDAELVTIVSDAASVDGTAHVLPTAAEALIHLEASTSCAYAGAFAGTFDGDFSGAMVLVVGQRRPELEFRPGAFAWLAYDDGENWEFGGGELSGVELSARPAIRYVDGADTMTASYTTPDRVAGSWDLPAGGHAASFLLGRLGPATGAYRFVGWMGGFRQDGALALSLEGDTVTGEAFDAIRGLRTRVTGSLEAEVMTLQSESQLLTSAVGTVSFDANGAPVSVTGTWGRTGAFHAVACRLD